LAECLRSLLLVFISRFGGVFEDFALVFISWFGGVFEEFAFGVHISNLAEYLRILASVF
jgi:hypothetical protein